MGGEISFFMKSCNYFESLVTRRVKLLRMVFVVLLVERRRNTGEIREKSFENVAKVGKSATR